MAQGDQSTSGATGQTTQFTPASRTQTWLSSGSDQPEPLPTEEEIKKLRAQLDPQTKRLRQQEQQQQRATLSDAWRSIQAGDFLKVHQYPCSRQGFLTGIGGGAAFGVLRFVLGAPIPRAANWAVGVGVAGAVAQFEFCQYRRRQEREKIRRVVEVYDRKQAESRRREQEEEERRRREAEAAEQEAARARSQRRWYRFW